MRGVTRRRPSTTGADRLNAEMGRGRPVFAYFNNTINAQAAEDAVRFRSALAARSTLR
jgi:uncharacterized protein YecE (DUF72 family)